MLLHLADPEERFSAVRLHSDFAVLDYAHSGDGWTLELGDLPVARLEYQLEVVDEGGHAEWALDPGNPHRAPGAFGEKSVLLLDGYEAPAWLAEEGVDGGYQDLSVRARGAEIAIRVWAPAGADPAEPLPLLVAHDGPEYDALSRLTHFSAVSIARGALPRHRVALLAPGVRDDWYSASARYGTAFAEAVLPALRDAVAVHGPVAGMGASLGGLAMLHVQRRHPGVLGALFLQSGSFFTPRYDAHEVRFSRYRRIVRFVREVLVTRTHPDPVPAVLTCGSAEENIHNNRLMATSLAAQGYAAVLHEVPDMHNYTAWRDAFDPHLPELLARAW